MNRRAVFSIFAAMAFINASSHAADGTAAPAPAAAASSSSMDTPKSQTAPAASAPETKPEAAPASKPEAKPESKAEAKPDSKPAAKLEEKSASDAGLRPAESKDRILVAAPEEKPAEPALNSCAAKLQPVADSYTQAHDSLLAWTRAASGKMDVADAKVADLKKQIAAKESQITQLKLESAKKNDAQARVLDQESRALWAQLKTEESKRRDLCRALMAAAGQKVRDLNRAVLDQLEAAASSRSE